MKIKIILSIMIMIGVAIAVLYQGVNRKAVNRVSAQVGGGCNSYSSDTDQCGNTETCGIGTYTIQCRISQWFWNRWIRTS